jgi:hypothetical protein
MLVALQSVLEGQHQYSMNEEESSVGTGEVAFGSCFQQGSSYMSMEHLIEDDGSDAGDVGAFSSVLVDSSPAWQPCPEPVAQLPMVCPPAAKSGAKPAKPAGANGEQEKPVTVMVCRHWKSKGWCRLGSECKFSHPDHKCGVGSNNANKGSQVGAGALADARVGGNSSDEAAVGPDGQKKARKRSSKDRGGKKKENTAAQPPPAFISAPPGNLLPSS